MSREYRSAASAAARPASLPDGGLPGPEAPAEAVLGWVSGDRSRAREALAAERLSRQPRPGLVDGLELLLAHFVLDGVRWVCAVDDVTILDVTELARMHNASAESPEGIAALGEFFETCLGPRYRAFRSHCRANRTSEDVLMDIMEGLLEDLAGYPTQPPSPSPGGPSGTGPTSKPASPERGRVVTAHGVRPMTPQEFAAWRERMGRETQELLEDQAEEFARAPREERDPSQPGFAYFG